MSITFMDYEIPVLLALVKLGGKAKPKDVYPEVEKIMELTSGQNPEEYETYDGKGYSVVKVRLIKTPTRV